MKYLAIFLVWLYRQTFSHVFRLLGVRCRFFPTCSAYSLEAFQKHGFFRGFWLSARRLGRCHPWGGSGIDEVPKA